MNIFTNRSTSRFFGFPIAALLLAPALMGTISACETMSPEERAAYESTPAVQVYDDVMDRTRVILKTRPLVTQGFSIKVPSNAKAIVLFFSGRDGIGGHTAELENYLPDKKIGFANISPPSDRPDGFASGGHRGGGDHVTDMEAVIRYVRRTYGLPIWLVGLSMGTVSVANVATSSRVRIDGVVFLSPITSGGTSGRLRGEAPVTLFSLGRLNVPVLAIGHQNDTCAATPPGGTRKIVDLASNAPVKEAKIVSGGRDTLESGCRVGPHILWGMEKELAKIITQFVVTNSDRNPGG